MYITIIVSSVLLSTIVFTAQMIGILGVTPKPVFYILPVVVGMIFGAMLSKVKIDSTKIKTLTGMIPICGYCHKIRDESGAWGVLERYLENNSNASFTHGICLECKDQVLEEIKAKKEAKKEAKEQKK